MIFEGRTRVTPGTPAPGQEAEARRHAGRPVEAPRVRGVRDDGPRACSARSPTRSRPASASSASRSSTRPARCRSARCRSSSSPRAAPRRGVRGGPLRHRRDEGAGADLEGGALRGRPRLDRAGRADAYSGGMSERRCASRPAALPNASTRSCVAPTTSPARGAPVPARPRPRPASARSCASSASAAWTATGCRSPPRSWSGTSAGRATGSLPGLPCRSRSRCASTTCRPSSSRSTSRTARSTSRSRRSCCRSRPSGGGRGRGEPDRRAALERIDANRTARLELLDVLGDAPRPWFGLTLSTPTMEAAPEDAARSWPPEPTSCGSGAGRARARAPPPRPRARARVLAPARRAAAASASPGVGRRANRRPRRPRDRPAGQPASAGRPPRARRRSGGGGGSVRPARDGRAGPRRAGAGARGGPRTD